MYFFLFVLFYLLPFFNLYVAFCLFAVLTHNPGYFIGLLFITAKYFISWALVYKSLQNIRENPSVCCGQEGDVPTEDSVVDQTGNYQAINNNQNYPPPSYTNKEHQRYPGPGQGYPTQNNSNNAYYLYTQGNMNIIPLIANLIITDLHHIIQIIERTNNFLKQ